MMRYKASTLTIIFATAVSFFLLGRQWEQRVIKLNWNRPFPKVEVRRREFAKPAAVDFALFWRVWETLGQSYLKQDKLDAQKMVLGAIAGMVQAVGDPYTAFLPPEINARVKEEIEGSFEGIGIQIGFHDDILTVIAPLAETPAAKVGIKAGDKILAIAGESTLGISLPEAQAKIRGERGTDVALTILHNGQPQPVEVKITRGIIVIKSLEWEVKDGILIFRLRRFSEQTEEEWNRAVTEALASNQPKGIVLDLRDNPGGLLTGAVYIASEFAPDGVVTKQQNADGSINDFRVNHRGKLLGLPVVVLINKGSASASEILAGALQQLISARLIGETSFGKGTIQEVEDLPNQTSLHITTGRWLLPNGKNLDEVGLAPDFEVKDATETADLDEPFEEAIGILKETID